MPPYEAQLLSLKEKIFCIKSKEEFTKLTIEVFWLQAEHNKIFKEFLFHLKINPKKVFSTSDIPFLPISLFKSHVIKTGSQRAQLTFESSGTAKQGKSKHYVVDPTLYEKSFLTGFKKFYGLPSAYRILALLPNYEQQGSSSLIYMVKKLIEDSGHPESGFFLNNTSHLKTILQKASERPTILIGVSYALLDLLKEGDIPLEHTIVMETGGMKGRRSEITRLELHNILKKGFGRKHIHSEYGMTELLSQAYALADGFFQCPIWMEMSVRDINDPLSKSIKGKAGGINIIDLANLYSCSFIATEDLGRETTKGVEILGRFDYTDMRGCNLLVAEN